MAKVSDLSTTIQYGNRTLTIHISEPLRKGNATEMRELQTALDNVVSAIEKNERQQGNRQSQGQWSSRQTNSLSPNPYRSQSNPPKSISLRQLGKIRALLAGDSHGEQEICERNGVHRLEDLTSNAAWHIINEIENPA